MPIIPIPADCSCNSEVPLDLYPQRSKQPIHPHIINPRPVAPGRYAMGQGTLHVFPVWLCPGKALEVNVVQTAPVQDHSIRVWVGTEPLGTQVTQQTYNLAFWHANRLSNEKVMLHDANTAQPKGYTALIPLPPGAYFINILNLINQPNGYSLQLTEF